MKIEQKAIKDLDISILDGDRGKNYPHQDEIFKAGYCLFLSANNVTKKGFDFNETSYISKEKDETLRGGKIQRNDIIITTRGTVGNIAYYDDLIPYENIRINSGMLIVRCGDKLNSKYIYYALKNRWFQEQIKSIQTGSAQPQLPKSHFIQMKLPVPSLNIQNRVANILWLLDQKINTNIRINDNLEKQAVALYQSLFVNYARLQKKEFVQSELGNMPTGWSVKSLSDVTTNIRTRVRGNNYKVLSAINSGCLQPSEEYFTKQVFSKDISNYIVVEENDFAYNPSRINIGSIGLNALGYTGCVSPIYVVFRTEPEYHFFMDFFIKSPRFNEEIRARASGSVRQAVGYKDFGLIRLIYPPLSVVQQFNNEYEKILMCIKRNLAENLVLENLRDVLLSKLMTGEFDLSNIDF